MNLAQKLRKQLPLFSLFYVELLLATTSLGAHCKSFFWRWYISLWVLLPNVTAIFYITTNFAWEEVKLGTKTLSIDMLDWMATMRRLVLRRPIFGTLTDITDMWGFFSLFALFFRKGLNSRKVWLKYQLAQSSSKENNPMQSSCNFRIFGSKMR